jgi:hypothetical protein
MFDDMHLLKKASKETIFFVFFFSRHPDKNNDPAAENRFVEINQAYEVRTWLLCMKVSVSGTSSSMRRLVCKCTIYFISCIAF